MSIISALREYLIEFSGIPEGAPLWTNYLGSSIKEYSIVQMPGARILETYINDVSVREYPFGFQSTESTADELARIQVAEFYEAFSAWLESQTGAGTLPDLGEGKKATAIFPDSWAFLYEQGQSDTGIYQVKCKLQYEQDPE